MTASTPRRPSTLFATAALAAAMAWVACASWRGLVEEPMRFTTPAFVAAALVAVTGAGLRSLRLRWYVVLPAQLAVVLVWFHHRLHVDTAGGGWLPTSHGISEAVHQVRHGAAQINYYAAPVHVERADAPVYLVAAAILVILAVDLIACGWGRVPWSGLPVIIAVTIPISVLDGGLPVPVFVITGLLFIALLATVETDHLLGWGEAVTGRRRRGDGGDGGDQILDRSSVAGPAFRIGAVTAVGALALGVLVPVTGGLPGGDGDGKGKGGSSSGSVRLTNP
ncbi:MAG: transglutaminaseTgpA domain-containing protein, partial [Marmoricola sp.]